jgi:hypothetical protein
VRKESRHLAHAGKALGVEVTPLDLHPLRHILKSNHHSSAQTSQRRGAERQIDPPSGRALQSDRFAVDSLAIVTRALKWRTASGEGRSAVTG